MSRTTIAAGVLGAAGLAGALALFSLVKARQAETRVPDDGRYINVDGARLHYIDIGSGPPIVFIHGLGGQLRHFTYALSEQLVSDHRLIIVDRPGSGYSRWTDSKDHGLAAQARVIAAMIDALGLDKPLIVGHSLGGAIALALALDTPQHVGGLALIAPLTQPVSEASPVFNALNIPSPLKRTLIAWTLAVPLSGRGRDVRLGAIFGPDEVSPDFAERGGGLLSVRPSAFIAASEEVSRGVGELEALTSRYAHLGLPVGILFGRGDRILPANYHGEKTNSLIPHSELLLIEGGHMIPLTKPDIVAAWVRKQAGRIVREGRGTRAPARAQTD